LHKKYAEAWHENETNIVIKMLAQSMKEQDRSRTVELQRSLLELEKKSDLPSDEESPMPVDFREIKLISDCYSSPIKSRSCPLSVDSGSPKDSVCSEGSPFSLKEEEYLRKAIMQNTKQYDMQINFMVIGNTGTGKTSLINSWLGSITPMQTKPTKGYFSRFLTI